MYAIVKDSGKQFKVQEGQEIEVDLRNASVGDEVRFDRVLAVSTGTELQVGSPVLEGASVVAKVIGVVQGPKLVIQKFRRRKNYRRRTGHRQLYTRVRIDKISLA